jgi:catechol 2,3-dioxygenase-like lactoylglutathione lyase family enzyme
MTPSANNAPTNLSHIGKIALSVTNIERSVGFYRDVLELPYKFAAGELAFFDCDGMRLFLDALPEAQGNGNSCIYSRSSTAHAIPTPSSLQTAIPLLINCAMLKPSCL